MPKLHALAGPATPAIDVRRLRKTYPGGVEAVKGIDFEVAAGEVFGLLGPNGAGKSTTVGMLTTTIRPTGGSARLAGFDVAAEPLAARSISSVVFQDAVVDRALTGRANLDLHARLWGVDGSETGELVDALGLSELVGRPVGTYSGGQRRRLEIARALVSRPRILFLDEPTVGLDPQTRSSIWQYLEQLKKDTTITIFLTTHYMDEAEHCDRIAIMDGGRLVALDTPEALKAGVGRDRVQIQGDDDADLIMRLRERFGIEAGIHDGAVTFSVEGGEQFVPRLIAELGAPIRSVSISRPSLDDVFMAHTGRTIRDAEATAADGMRMFARMGRR